MRSKFTLILILFGALLSMGAKFTMQPVEDFSAVAGTWNGAGKDWNGAFTPKAGMSFPLKFVVKQDGSFEIDASYRLADKGTLKIRDGKMHYHSSPQGPVTVTLFEHKGKPVLKGASEDGGITWEVKRAK